MMQGVIPLGGSPLSKAVTGASKWVNALFQISKTDFADHTIAVMVIYIMVRSLTVFPRTQFASSSCRHSAVLLPTLSSVARRLHRPNLAFFSVNVNRLNSYTLPAPSAPPSDIEERAMQQAIYGPVNSLEEPVQSKHAGLFSSMLVVRATPTLLAHPQGPPSGLLGGSQRLPRDHTVVDQRRWPERI